MRVLFAGSPQAALPALRALLDSPHEVVGVLTRPDARAGRGRALRPAPVAAAAVAARVPVLRPDRPGTPAALTEINALDADCAVVVAYGALLPQTVLDAVPRGWVNLHFSLLPRWRGAAPVQHALFAGDGATGATTFRLVRELDAGPVFRSVRTVIGGQDTYGSLLARLAEDGADLLGPTLADLADGVQPTPQPAAGVTLAPKVAVADARIDWSADAHRIDRRIRGCTPVPGGWTTFRDARVKVGPVRTRDPGTTPEQAPGPGGIAVRSGPARVVVGTGTTPVVLSTVQPAGRPVMDALAWVRGVRPAAGDGFDR